MRFAIVTPAPENAILRYVEFATLPDGSVTASDIKPRIIPVVVVDITIDPVTEVKEGPTVTVSATEVTETYTKRAKTQPEIDAMKAAKILAVTREGDRRLALQVTASRQVYALAALVRLLYLHTDTTSWPQGQKDQIAVMVARLTPIQDIRAIEEAKVTAVQALTTAAQIAAYDELAGW